MIKGLAIFGAGVGTGYGLALKNREPTDEFLKSAKAIVNDAWLDLKKERADLKKAAEATPEDVINGGEKQAPESAEDAAEEEPVSPT